MPTEKKKLDKSRKERKRIEGQVRILSIVQTIKYYGEEGRKERKKMDDRVLKEDNSLLSFNAGSLLFWLKIILLQCA